MTFFLELVGTCEAITSGEPPGFDALNRVGFASMGGL